MRVYDERVREVCGGWPWGDERVRLACGGREWGARGGWGGFNDQALSGCGTGDLGEGGCYLRVYLLLFSQDILHTPYHKVFNIMIQE